MKLKPPTIPFGVVACTLSDNLPQNSCLSVAEELQDDVNTVNVSMRMSFIFFVNNKLSLLNLNMLVVQHVIPSDIIIIIISDIIVTLY